jgi:MEMO1 family protein
MSIRRVRRPVVAGRFYPAEAGALERSVASYLAEAEAALGGREQEPAPKALIVPHAGYVYSAPIAASAYVRIRPLASVIRCVVLLGPSHRVHVEGLATSSADTFATPLGEIPLDRDAIARALELPQVRLLDAAHLHEHSLEVQLPFLQQVLGAFSLVPFSVGDASVAEVAEVIELLWGGEETLFVISSDLSHYYDYETARRLDATTTRAIEALDPSGLDSESACGRVPVRGLLDCARRHGLRARTLDLRNSGDTAGSRDQVVGYGAYAFA